MSPTPVTVVIASRDRPHLVRGAVAAAQAALRSGDSLILVDSASADPNGMAELAREMGATLVRSDEPGTSRARNLGWRAASTDLVAFTDDDCLPDERWLETAVRALEDEPSAGFVTGRVVPEFTTAPRAWLHLSVTSRTEPTSFSCGDDPTEVGHGANMTWRRSALERIGGFDEALGPGTPLRAAEDVDAFWRSLMAGGLGRFLPDSIVVHRQWRGRRHQLRAYVGYGVGAGALAVKRWRTPKGGQRRLSWWTILGKSLNEFVWRHGIRGVARNLSRRFAMGTLSELAMSAGALQGVFRACRLGLVDGHFVYPG